MKKPTFIDLFSGAGGLSLGLRQAGYVPLLGVDNRDSQVETYQRNIGKAVKADLRKLSASKIKRAAGRAPDLVVGSPPCEGISSLNRNLNARGHSEADRNSLIGRFGKLVSDLSPRAFIFENVKGVLGKKGKKYLEPMLQQLRKNYQIECGVLRCDQFGVPQLRARAFCVGVRKGYGAPALPSPTSTRPMDACEALGIKGKKTPSAPFGDCKSHTKRRRIVCGRPSPALSSEHGVYDLNCKKLGARELKILQGFPRDFWVPEKCGDHRIAIGASVCPPVARALGKKLLPAISGERGRRRRGRSPAQYPMLTPSIRIRIRWRLGPA